MQRTIVSAMLVLGLFGFSNPARSEVSEPYELWRGFEDRKIEGLLRELGRVTSFAGQDVQSWIEGGSSTHAVTTADGLKYYVTTHRCEWESHTDNSCHELIVWSDTDVSDGRTLDQFNEAHLATSAHRATHGTLIVARLSRVVIADFGVTKGNVAANLAAFESSLKAFKR